MAKSSPEDKVYLAIRNEKTTIYIDCDSKTTVLELKKEICTLIDALPENLQIYKDNDIGHFFQFFNFNFKILKIEIQLCFILDDPKPLAKLNITKETARAQQPQPLRYVTKGEGDEMFEEPKIVPYSIPQTTSSSLANA